MNSAEILKKVRQIEIQTNKLVSETFAGEYLSTFKGQGIEFAEVRPYTPGDDVRAIDWNVTARTGTPFIKKYNEERELTLFIACDVSASQQFGSTDKLKQEIAAELAALFAFSALRNSDKVGLMLFSDTIELFVPPKKGKKHILRLIRELVAFEPKHTTTDINLCLKTLLQVLKHSGIVILISDFIAPINQFEKNFKLAAKKFDLIPVVLQDKLEEKFPRLPVCIDITDPETGEEDVISLAAPELNLALANFNMARELQLRNLFIPFKIDAIHIDTSLPAADPVIAFFKARAKKIRK